MRMTAIVLLVVLVLLIVFAVFNYDALTFPHTVNLFGAATYRAPLGMLLLILGAILALIFYLLGSLTDLRARADSARTLREMEALRASLDQHEQSRFTQLQAYLQERFAILEANSNATLAERVEARVDRVRDEIAADIGQIDDYLRRRLGSASSPDGQYPPDRQL